MTPEVKQVLKDHDGLVRILDRENEKWLALCRKTFGKAAK